MPMQNRERLKMLQQIKRAMEEQRKLGYPYFKAQIVQALVDKYEVDEERAKSYVFHPMVEEWIMKDIAWAQHMGPEYWADTIYSSQFQIEKRALVI
jgi:hypothetical protein